MPFLGFPLVLVYSTVFIDSFPVLFTFIFLFSAFKDSFFLASDFFLFSFCLTLCVSRFYPFTRTSIISSISFLVCTFLFHSIIRYPLFLSKDRASVFSSLLYILSFSYFVDWKFTFPLNNCCFQASFLDISILLPVFCNLLFFAP